MTAAPALGMPRNRVVVVVGSTVAVIGLVISSLTLGEVGSTTLPWVLSTIPMLLVGSLLVWRVPENRVGWILFGIVVAASGTSLSAIESQPWLNAGAIAVNTAAISLLALLLLAFPDGQLLSPRWRPVAGIVIANAVFGGVIAFLVGGWGGDVNQAVVLSPLYEATVAFTEVGAIVHTAMMGFGLAAALVSLVLRFRQADREGRQQLKWLLVAVAYFLGALAVTGGGGGIWQAVVLAAGLALIPTAIGVAVLRYRLYDVDVVISRSITYLGLAAAISLIYGAIVVAPLLIFRSSQDEEPNLVLALLATVVVAVLFEPARARLERWANRLVYGERSTPHQVLSQIASRLSDARATSGDLAELLAHGTGAETAAIWRRSGKRLVADGVFPSEFAPEPIGPDALEQFSAAAPVVHLDETLGAITISKHPSDPVTPADEELLDSVAATAGLVIRNESLYRQLEQRAIEVRESRQRLIAAQDAERRRLERDLHDGAQQQVVALKVKLGLARKLAEREGADDLTDSIAILSDETQTAVDAMRVVAHGIYPPLLEAEGLKAALGALQRTSPVTLTVVNGDLGRYDRRIEQTAYFFVSESVDRAHMAGAHDVHVDLVDKSGALTITLDHDGRSTVTGGTAISDRIDAFGGTTNSEVTATQRNRTVVTIPPVPDVQEET